MRCSKMGSGLGVLVHRTGLCAPPLVMLTPTRNSDAENGHKLVGGRLKNWIGCGRQRIHSVKCRSAASGIPPTPAKTITRTSRRRREGSEFGSPEGVSVAGIFEGLPKVVLKGGKSKLFTGDYKSPTVYGGAIDRVVGKPPPVGGAPVVVCNGSEDILGWGIFNPDSMYRVRMLQTVEDMGQCASSTIEEEVESIMTGRVKAAWELRQMMGLSGSQDANANAFRLVNSEGDRLSGLIVDIVGSVAVVRSSALWVEQKRDIFEKIILDTVPHVQHVVWRSAIELLREEGMEVVNEESNVGVVETITVEEYGAKFVVDPYGQKTGFYADQRENRVLIRDVAQGKNVLDLCCYSGGFSIQAALGGGSSVTGVDSSAPAIELARQNAAINKVQADFVQMDVTEFMKMSINEGRLWDIVILDPPKLAPNRKSLLKATRKYVSLNTMAMKLVRPGGLLMTCSCSGAMTQSGNFIKVIQAASNFAGRKATLLTKRGAGGDHCMDPGYPEGEYLSNYTVRIDY